MRNNLSQLTQIGSDGDDNDSNGIIIALLVIIGVLLLIIIVGIAYVWRRQSQASKKTVDNTAAVVGGSDVEMNETQK